MQATKDILLSWLPLAVVITVLCALIYGTVQQNYRQSLNDPQIQMAEDLAARTLESQLSASFIEDFASSTINISRELDAWEGLYTVDAEGSVGVIATTGYISTGYLNDQPAMPPAGALAAARDDAGKDTTQPYENRVTWQAANGTRQAIVVDYVPQLHVYAVAGRNMREVEDREGRLSMMVFLGWLAAIVLSLFFSAIAWYVRKRGY